MGIAADRSNRQHVYAQYLLENILLLCRRRLYRRADHQSRANRQADTTRMLAE